MTVVCPSGMIFVPSGDGLSHSPRELTKDQDRINGANVPLGTVSISTTSTDVSVRRMAITISHIPQG
jgi:hypothetical protein